MTKGSGKLKAKFKRMVRKLRKSVAEGKRRIEEAQRIIENSNLAKELKQFDPTAVEDAIATLGQGVVEGEVAVLTDNPLLAVKSGVDIAEGAVEFGESVKPLVDAGKRDRGIVNRLGKALKGDF